MRAIAIWICLCAYLNSAGWTLSALHALNATGGAAVLLLGAAALVAMWRKTSEAAFPELRVKKLRHRFRRPFPLIFLLAASLIFIGGATHAPNNFDALNYRLPRMLNWLSAGHWFWVPTGDERMNYATPGWEWMALPFFAVLHSDRGLFLLNVAGFVLMPGLLFSVFRQMGVARRTAWAWMWILPLAYGYATQAGSVGNDLTGAVFCLASVHFGLRARRSGKITDVWLCGLAAALTTGTKLSNLPLLLPCLVAVGPALMRLREKWLASAAIAGMAVLISAAPTAVLNHMHTGSWNGDPENAVQLQARYPGAALLGNGLLLLQQSFMPPVLPDARNVNDRLNDALPASWQQTLKEKFPRYDKMPLNELPQEEASGLGLSVTLLLLAGTVAGATGWKKSAAKILAPPALVGFAAWVAASFYMMKAGSEATARLMLPYYPLAIAPLLLLPAHGRLLRFRAWRIFAALAGLSVLPAIVLSPARPLFPAVRATENFAREHPASALAQRLAAVYSTYARRNDALKPLRAALPDDAREIGFAASENDTDYSLWRPFGRRRIIYLQPGANQSVGVPAGVEWIAVKQRTWPEFSRVPLEQWAEQHHAKIVLSVPIATVVAWGEETWCLLHVEKP